MRALLSILLAAGCLGFCITAAASEMMPTPATTNEGVGSLERDTTGQVLDGTTHPDSGSTMTQQRMEEDRNDGRNRDALKRKKRDRPWEIPKSDKKRSL